MHSDPDISRKELSEAAAKAAAIMERFVAEGLVSVTDDLADLAHDDLARKQVVGSLVGLPDGAADPKEVRRALVLLKVPERNLAPR